MIEPKKDGSYFSAGRSICLSTRTAGGMELPAIAFMSYFRPARDKGTEKVGNKLFYELILLGAAASGLQQRMNSLIKCVPLSLVA